MKIAKPNKKRAIVFRPHVVFGVLVAAYLMLAGRHLMNSSKAVLSSTTTTTLEEKVAKLAANQRQSPIASVTTALRKSHGKSNPTTTTSSVTAAKGILKNDLNGLNSDKLWTTFVNHATDLIISGDHHTIIGVAMEVGMHSAKQCLEAATAGLEAYCFEPSPASYQRVTNQVNLQTPDVKKRVHVFNRAASSTSDGTIDFKTSGGTGDHVGEFDMWRMKKTTDAADMKGGHIVKVPQVKLDHVIGKLSGGVFLLKVDTQGFEPIVFSGLTESLKQHKIQFVLTEYWPRGMDLHAGKPDACVGAQLLEQLSNAGYTLYALTVTAHPKAPKGYKRVVEERPLDDLVKNCKWYFDLEQQFPSQEYKMGYWSDVLAVAPGVVDETQLVSKLRNWT